MQEKTTNRIGKKRQRIFNNPSKSSQNLMNIPQYKTCSLCENQVHLYRFAKMAFCQHIFCQNCLMEYIMFKINSFELITCPEQNCFSLINESCGLYLCLSDEERKKYQKIKFRKEIDQNPQKLVCPDENCEEGWIKIKDKNQKQGQCLKCQKTYCLRCMELKHVGTKCDNDEAKKITKQYKYRRCRGCRRIVQRIQGCNHMTCICGDQFCYICGSPWDYNHKCPFFQEEESVCWKLQNYLDEFRCCLCFEKPETKLERGCSYFLKGLSFSIYCFLVFLWSINCILIGSILAIFLIPIYLVHGNIFFFQEMCKERKPCCPILIYFLILPISILFMAGVKFLIDIHERRIEFVWRICFTATLQSERD